MAGANKVLRARDSAITRGLDFIYRFGSKQQCFADYGSYLICCFALLAATSRTPKLRRLGRDRAEEFIRRWSRLHQSLPVNADADRLLEFVLVRYAQCRLGSRDSADAAAISEVVRKLSASDLIGFEPKEEPPPDDLPFPCDCTFQNQRGRKTCKQCKRRLRMRSRYRVWMEALANTYVAERSGVPFGATYGDVLKWRRSMRPYPIIGQADEDLVREAIYAVTHVVYTLNDYGTHQLSPHWLPEEFAFLKANLEAACARDDSEVLGELLDSLKAFGLHASHPLIVRGTEYLLAKQNKDGSWGDPDEENIRTRCHTTWTAIDGLRTYAWRQQRLLQGAIKSLLNVIV